MLISEPPPPASAALPAYRAPEAGIGEFGRLPAGGSPGVAHAAEPVKGPRISVVVPAKNEEQNIGWVLERLPAGLHEVILVDGHSTDHTVLEAIRVRPDARVLHQRSRGKGAALAMGLTATTGDIAVIIDADGSMDPAEIPALVGALLSGADVAKGSRAAAGGGSHDLSGLRRLGNRALTYLANRIYHQVWRELCYGYAAFWTDVLPLLGVPDLTQDEDADRVDGIPAGAAPAQIGYGHGFEIEALLFCRAAKARLRVAEVFSFEHERRHGESNLATFRDGWRVLWAVWRERRFRSEPLAVGWHHRRYPVVPHLHAVQRPLKKVAG